MVDSKSFALCVGTVVAHLTLAGALVEVFRRFTRPETDLFAWGYEAGERKGYREGREAGRPTVVRMGTKQTG